MYIMPISQSYCYDVYGFRQSSLIQWSPYRKRILGRFDRCSCTPLLVYGVDRSCYYDRFCYLKDRSLCEIREGLRKSMVFGKRCSLGGLNEADVMLSLLSEERDDECFDLREEDMRLIEKRVVQKKGRSEVCNECGAKKKRVASGLSEREYEADEYRSRDEGRGRREEKIRGEEERLALLKSGKENQKMGAKEEERETLLRKENRMARTKEDRKGAYVRKENQIIREEEERTALLRRKNQILREKDEKEALLRKERLKAERQKQEEEEEEEERKSLRKERLKAQLRELEEEEEEEEKEERKSLKDNWRARKEEREEFLRREDHRQRLRRDGSSCSSYYSLSSAGDYEQDNEVEVRHGAYVGGTCDGHERNSKLDSKFFYEEVGEEVRKHEDIKHNALGMKKTSTAVGSTVTDSDFRKKTEKKLTDTNILVQESDSKEETLQKESRFSKICEGNEKASGAYIRYDDRKTKSTLEVEFNEGGEQHRKTGGEVARQSETRMKYKQFAQMLADQEVYTAYGSTQLNRASEEMSTKARGPSQQPAEEHQLVGGRNRKEEYQRDSVKVTEASKVDVRKTLISQQQSESSTKREGNYSTTVVTAVDAGKQQYEQANRLVESRGNANGKPKQFNEKDITSVSQATLGNSIIQQQNNVNLTYGSSTESKEKHAQAHSRYTRGVDSRTGLEGSSNEPLTPGTSGIIVLEGRNNTKAESLTEPSLAQLAERKSLRIESTSGLAVEEITEGSAPVGSLVSPKHRLDRFPELRHEGYYRDNIDESHGKSLEFTSHEDAIGSADQFQKASAHYFGEFVDKASHEMSSYEIQKEKSTSDAKSKLVEQQDQKALIPHGSQDSELKDRDPKRSSQGSGPKGPSDEMWDVDEPSGRGSFKAEVQEDASKTETAVVRRSGKSLWNLIGDIVRLRWSSHSEGHSTGGKSGGRSSPPQSTTSEVWFSGHEADEIEETNGRKERKSTTEDLRSPKKHQEGKPGSQDVEGSSLSTSNGHSNVVGTDIVSSPVVSYSGPVSAGISSPSTSAKEIPRRNFEGTSSAAAFQESSTPLPAMRLRRSLHVQDKEADASGSSKDKQQISSVSVDNSEPVVNEGELGRKRLQRRDQLIRDRFDEWEEAYVLETEQRKIDEIFMREAILEGKRAADNWEVPVGAVLVHNGKIIARGCNLVEELRDSTAHAEMICIREASNVLRTWRLSETTLYVTLEPCPMCAGAILQARIDTVVWGAPNKLLGADGSWIKLFPDGDRGNGFEQTDKPPAPVHPFHPKITIRRGVLASECADTMQQFFRLRRKKKDKKPDPPTPPSCLPISHHPSKFMTKLQDAFHIMFCL